MRARTLGALLLIIGVVLVVAGIVVMFVIVPGMKQFPADVDTTRQYAGTMPVLLNPQTFKFMQNVPVDLERHFMTEEVDDGLALVLEEQTLSSAGQPLSQMIKRHAIDRKSMEFVTDFPAAWAEKPGFAARRGLVLGWPMDTEKKDYAGWSDDYADNVTLKFDSVVVHPRAEIETYYFTAASDPRPIVPETVTAMGLPPALSHEQIAGLIGSMEGVNPLIAQALPTLIQQAGWPDPVPLSYVYEYTGEYWIEPVTGVLIDTHKVEIRKAGFSDELMAALMERIDALPIEVDPELVGNLLPVTVFHLDYQATDQSVQDAKIDAQDAKDMIELFGTILPVAAIGLGLIFGILGIFGLLRR